MSFPSHAAAYDAINTFFLYATGNRDRGLTNGNVDLFTYLDTVSKRALNGRTKNYQMFRNARNELKMCVYTSSKFIFFGVNLFLFEFL